MPSSNPGLQKNLRKDSSVNNKKKFFPMFVAKGKELDYTDFRKITQIYRRYFNLCNRLLICVIRSFPFAYGLKMKFLKKPVCFHLVTNNTCYKVGKASKKIGFL